LKSITLNKYILCITFFSASIANGQSFSLEKNDSIFSKFSIDQVVNYKTTLQSKIKRNLSQRDALNKQGLEVNKNILESKASIGANQDVMLLRLAEFYIDEAEDLYYEKNAGYDKEFEKYIVKLEAYEADTTGTKVLPEPPKEIERDYTKAISMYDRILNEFPNSELKDEALYSKAHLLQDSGHGKESRVLFRKLIDEYSTSSFAPYGIMALADYYFEPGEEREGDQVEQDLRTSIELFKGILSFKEFDRYDEALYRLGWAYYRLSARDKRHYVDAIYYFTLALDDIYVGGSMDIGSSYTNVNIKDESVRYIGICFAQEDNPKGGVENLRKYVQRLVKLEKPYASAIMKSLGDIYYEVREDQNTIAAYTAFQELFPFDKESAKIQNRVVTAYRVFDEKIEYRSDSRSFEERYNMFKKYNARSEWYTQLLALDIPDKFEILSDAEKNAERALLLNIQLLYRDILDKEGEKLVNENDYKKLAQMCEEYLDFFPNFDDAFQVHRSYAEILDTKLNYFDKAYEEYIEVSNIYPNTSIKELKAAAYNAVVVADTLRGLAGDKDIKFKFSTEDSIKSESLSASEKRIIEAYENYIKIAPNDSNSAKFLYNISAIYFNRKQFANATRYSKTLLLRFPGAEGEALARQQVLNGYYARGQYLSAEAVARKIINDKNSDPAHVEEAKQRLFDSILKSAESYQLKNRHYISGLEFRRAALDAPFETRENRRFIALYNSGKEFEKVNDLEEANTSYAYILEKEEKLNTFTKNALVNSAFNYKALEQNKRAGEFFERIYLDYPDSADANVYLANAGASYQVSESWLDAIRINNIYANTFPTDEKSKDFLFNNAEFYLKLDDFENANQIYNEFTAKYPDDPRTIEAHYKRGKYYYDRGDIVDAKPEFFKAVERNERFKREKKKTDNFHAGEAAFFLIQLDEEEYSKIVFTWPKQNIEAQKKLKTEKLNTIKQNYEKLISYGSPRSFEAPYKIALLYERFADTFSNQETDPTERDQAQIIRNEADIRATSAKLYDNSIDKYKQAITDIEKIAAKLKIDLDGESEPAPPDTTKSKTIATPNSMNSDSLRLVANRYIEKSKEKVTSVVFLIAKQSEENIANSLNYKSRYEGVIGQEANNLLFKDEILKKSVEILVEKSIEAHRRNLKTSVELGISNRYVEESKRRIIINSNIIANEYNKLTTASLNQFKDYYNEYVDLIPKPYGQRSKKYKGDYNELYDNLNTFLDYATDFNSKSLEGYKSTIEAAREDSINNDLFEYTQKNILDGSFNYVHTIETVRDSLIKKHDYFKLESERRSEDDELKYNFEDGKNNLEEVKYTLDESILTALDLSFSTSQNLSLPASPTYVKILKKLIKLDPTTYAGEIPKEKITIQTDSTWLVSKTYNDSSIFLTFDDSDWKQPLVLDNSIAIKALDTLAAQVDPIWYGTKVVSREVVDSTTITNLPELYTDTITGEFYYYSSLDSNQVPVRLEIDSTTNLPYGFEPEYAIKNVQFSSDSLDAMEIFYRKKFTMGGRLFSGRFIGTGDGIVDLFMNGQLITSFSNTKYDSVDTGNHTFFSEYVNIGENIISIWLKDLNKPRNGLRFYLELNILPREFSQDEDTVIDETTVLTLAEEMQVQKRIKNRIVTKSLEDYSKKIQQSNLTPSNQDMKKDELNKPIIQDDTPVTNDTAPVETESDDEETPNEN
jgi:tetratricopeptide (TPR) repeat protein